MSTAVWNPTTYLAFADERSRPFADLTSRIGATAPRTVVDLGCGPGQLTAGLAHRWPDASILGLDSSPEMIERAQQHSAPGLAFEVADLRGWSPTPRSTSSSAMPPCSGYLTTSTCCPDSVDALAPDGWLAIQVPGNFDAPATGCSTSWRPTRGSPTRRAGSSGRPPRCSDVPRRPGQLGLAVDAWETTYLHVLDGPDPVFRWISGTGARPVLQALGDSSGPSSSRSTRHCCARPIRAAARHRAALPADVRRRPQAAAGSATGAA